MDDQTDYKGHVRVMEKAMSSALTGSERFIALNQRKVHSELTYDRIRLQNRARYFTKYRDVFLMKGPEDLLIYQQWLQAVKPKTILEFGAFSGASALWFTDICRLNDFKCKIYSVDIDITLIDEKVRKLTSDDVTFVQGDCYKVEEIFTPSLLSSLEHPVALIDDVHHNTFGILEFFHKYLVSGDYVIVEDTHPSIPLYARIDADDYEQAGDGKFQEVKKFCQSFDGSYAVDTFFADFLGYNCTWNTWLRKMK